MERAEVDVATTVRGECGADVPVVDCAAEPFGRGGLRHFVVPVVMGMVSAGSMSGCFGCYISGGET